MKFYVIDNTPTGNFGLIGPFAERADAEIWANKMQSGESIVKTVGPMAGISILSPKSFEQLVANKVDHYR